MQTLTVVSPRGNGTSRREYNAQDFQSIQGWEDKINEAITILAANTDVLAALRKYYQGLMTHTDFPLKGLCAESVAVFSTEIDSMIYELNMQASRAKFLIQVTTDWKSLVRYHPCDVDDNGVFLKGTQNLTSFRSDNT